jgi:hypothetical protein
VERTSAACCLLFGKGRAIVCVVLLHTRVCVQRRLFATHICFTVHGPHKGFRVFPNPVSKTVPKEQSKIVCFMLLASLAL